MTQKENLQRGELYRVDEELMGELAHAKRLCEEYNSTSRDDKERRRAIIHALLGKHGENFNIESNVWFDYGYNTEVGENFYVNHDCVFLDTNKLIFGDNVYIAPQCGFYTAGHPLDAMLRRQELEFAKPIIVEQCRRGESRKSYQKVETIIKKERGSDEPLCRKVMFFTPSPFKEKIFFQNTKKS